MHLDSRYKMIIWKSPGQKLQNVPNFAKTKKIIDLAKN